MAKRYPAQKLLIPYAGQPALTAVLRDEKTGNVLHAVSGDCQSSVSFADGRISASRHPQSGDWVVIIPATDIKTLYGTLYHKPASEVIKDTVPDSPSAAAFLFDTADGCVFTDAVPTRNGKIRVER